MTSDANIGSTKEASWVLCRALGDPGALDSDDRVQFSLLLTTIVAEAGSSFEAFGRGIIALASFESTSHQALQLLTTPGGRDPWTTFASTFPAGFKAHVDRELGSVWRDVSPAVQQVVAADAQFLVPIDPWYRSGSGRSSSALTVSAVGCR